MSLKTGELGYILLGMRRRNLGRWICRSRRWGLWWRTWFGNLISCLAESVVKCGFVLEGLGLDLYGDNAGEVWRF